MQDFRDFHSILRLRAASRIAATTDRLALNLADTCDDRCKYMPLASRGQSGPCGHARYRVRAENLALQPLNRLLAEAETSLR